jgi:RNA polymerase I-specific transcription initiation factor RRN7
MSFPLETYSIARRIASLIRLDEFRLTGGAKWRRSGGYPDSKLMALLIIACKLGFNLEASPAWQDWSVATTDEEGRDKGAANEDIDENNILEMSDEKLDEYMDWVQSEWIEEDPQLPGMKIELKLAEFC